MWKTLAAFAVLGGLLEILNVVLSFWVSSAQLDPLYVAIDLCFLFGVLSLYLPVQALVGRVGLLGFCLALAGFGLIAGPEADLLGVSVYLLGKPMIGLGLLLLCGQTFIQQPAHRLVPGVLLASVLVGSLAMLVGGAPNYLGLLSSTLLGAGFIFHGLGQWLKHSVPA